MNQTLLEQYVAVMSTNLLYQRNKDHWDFLLNSYMGGVEYQRGQYLTRYVNETDSEYNGRIAATHLENHAKSVISTYISFLFREEPDRDFNNNGMSFELEMFLRDADLDGRSFNAFMKEVAVWSSVFGHCWVLVTKPNVGAITLGEEQAAQVRPYVNLVTPLTVTDWNWHRKPNGQFELTYFKYIEESNDTFATIREWTKETIKTYIVNNRSRAVQEETEEINGLGKIPAVLAYNHRSPVRGIGVSDISDIAHAQMTIYNLTSEVEQSVRINGHPALVKTAGTEASAGAGAIVQMEDNLDPGLRPYILSVSTDINSIFNAIGHVTDAIDKMANTGSIRATESRRMSGVAQKQEFELLNAKLSEKADNLELTEEQIWQYWFEYQGQQWMGEINYPDGFNIADTSNEIDNLVKAKGASTDPAVARVVDEMLLEALGSEKERLPYQDINPIVGRTYPDGGAIPESLPPAYMPAVDSGYQDQNCANCEYYKASEGYCTKFDANVRAVYWCAKWEPMED
jgi:hypothetical protein